MTLGEGVCRHLAGVEGLVRGSTESSCLTAATLSVLTHLAVTCRTADTCAIQLGERVLASMHAQLVQVSRTDARHTIDTAKRNRLWPEAYKISLDEAAAQRGGHHAGRVMISDGAVRSTRRQWMRERVSKCIARSWRYYAQKPTGTFHVQSDASRVGNPARELEVAILGHFTESGTCIGTALPPQVHM
eukprot:6109875-Amphidinium_carterae.3